MDFITIASIIGLSTIVSAVITFILDNFKKRNDIRFSKVFEEKYRRYNHILAIMLNILDPNNMDTVTNGNEDRGRIKEKLAQNGIEAVKLEFIRDYKSYINYYYLFANKKVMVALNIFYTDPSEMNYIKAAQEMRKDLWK